MTLDEALTDIEHLSRSKLRGPPVARKEISCRDTQQAVRLLAEAYQHLRQRDALYADWRRCACLVPPPASVPPD